MIEKFKIPRCYLCDSREAIVQLYTFGDACSKAYTSVSYFRIVSNQGIHTVIAGFRVSLLKTVSMPTLELQAAVVGPAYQIALKKLNTEISHHYYWTYSSTVISWLHSDPRRLKPFVSHKMSEILGISDESRGHGISTQDNVAYETTRDNAVGNWSEHSRWIITENMSEINDIIDEFYSEIEKEYVFVKIEGGNLAQGIRKIEGFSSYLRLIRSTALILRAIKVFKGTKTFPKKFIPKEMIEEENILIKHVSFKDIRNLKIDKAIEEEWGSQKT